VAGHRAGDPFTFACPLDPERNMAGTAVAGTDPMGGSSDRREPRANRLGVVPPSAGDLGLATASNCRLADQRAGSAPRWWLAVDPLA
jgi:hypothetical protein